MPAPSTPRVRTDGSDKWARPHEPPRPLCSCREGLGLTGRCFDSHCESLSADLSMMSSQDSKDHVCITISKVTCDDVEKFLLLDNFRDWYELAMVLMTLK